MLVKTDPKDLENGDKRQEHFKKVKPNDSAKEKASKSPKCPDTDSDLDDNILRDMGTSSRKTFNMHYR